MLRSAAIVLALASGQLTVAPCASAQTAPDSTPVAPALRPDSAATGAQARQWHSIRWYEPVVLLSGLALTSALDETVANHFRNHRSQTGDDIANAWAKVGTVGVGVVTAGVLAGGLISHNDKVTHAGLRLLFSAGLAAAAVEGMKTAIGRERPFENTNAFDFDPSKFDSSFPGGHASLAFAMATSLSDDIGRPWATVALFGVATGVAVSRIYQQEHWVTDCVGGAALGIASAKLVSGRWRIFGLRSPSFLISSRGPVVGWSVAFRE